MPSAAYSRGQRLNDYHEMLHTIYGSTQNYAKSKYEVLSHLSEVCGIAGKHILKKRDLDQAIRFMPKIFGWACALLKIVAPQENDTQRSRSIMSSRLRLRTGQKSPRVRLHRNQIRPPPRRHPFWNSRLKSLLLQVTNVRPELPEFAIAARLASGSADRPKSTDTPNRDRR
jgi:hypothetical protein